MAGIALGEGLEAVRVVTLFLKNEETGMFVEGVRIGSVVFNTDKV